MSEDQKYNGWTNYETWNVALHIDNDESSQNYWHETAREIAENTEAEETFTKDENARMTLASELKSAFEIEMPVVNGCWADLLNAALSEVNWHEIAGNLLETASEIKNYEAVS